MKYLIIFSLLFISCVPLINREHQTHRKLQYIKENNLPAHIEDSILNNKICVGMSFKEVCISWPNYRYQREYSHGGIFGTTEVYIFNNGWDAIFLRFVNGKLRSWYRDR